MGTAGVGTLASPVGRAVVATRSTRELGNRQYGCPLARRGLNLLQSGTTLRVVNSPRGARCHNTRARRFCPKNARSRLQKSRPGVPDSGCLDFRHPPNRILDRTMHSKRQSFAILRRMRNRSNDQFLPDSISAALLSEAFLENSSSPEANEEFMKSCLAVVGRRQGIATGAADARSGQAGRAVWRRLPDHRLRLSNCLNSGIRQMLVLTQYKAMSLDRHINLGWRHYFLPRAGRVHRRRAAAAADRRDTGIRARPTPSTRTSTRSRRSGPSTS